MIDHATKRVVATEWVALSIVVPGVALLYALNWYPGPGGRVWYGDSVGFQYWAVSHSLGHSPGYPQYLALIRAAARVPLGQAWQRVNFISSSFAALALGAHYLLNRALGLPKTAACVAAVVLGLSRTFFTQATEAEVYALNAFWVLSCLALFVMYLNQRQRSVLFAFFVTFGLALGHHPTGKRMLRVWRSPSASRITSTRIDCSWNRS